MPGRAADAAPSREELLQEVAHLRRRLRLEVARRERLERELGQSEQGLDQAFRYLPLVYAITTLGEGRLLYVNETFSRVLGFTAEEALGHRYTDLGILSSAEFAILMEAVRTHGRVNGVELMAQTRDRRLVPMRMFAEVIEIEGAPCLVAAIEDVSAQRLAESELRRFGQMVSSTSDPMAFLDRDLIYRTVNRACEAAWGVSAERIVGRHKRELLGEAAYAEVEPLLQRCLAGETVHDRRWQETPGVGRRFLDMQYAPYRGEAGAVAGITVSIRDLTPLQQAYEELERNRRRLQLALIGAQAGSFFYDIAADRLEWDERTMELYGCSPETFSGRFEDWSSRVHPEDRAAAQAGFEAAVAAASTFDLYFRVIRPDGAVRHIHGLGYLERDATGQAHAVSGLHFDVTAEQEARDRIASALRETEAVFDNSPVGMVLLDEQRRFQRVNSQITCIFGYRPEELIGRTSRILYPSEEEYLEVSTLAYAHLCEHAYFEIERILRRKDGALFWCHLRGMPVAHGEPDKGLVWSLEDVTARRRHQEALQRHTLELSLLNRVGDILLSSLDLDELLRRIIAEVRRQLGVSGTSFWLLSEDGHAVECRYADGRVSTGVVGARLRLGEGITGWVAQRRQAVQVADTRNDPRHYTRIDRDTGVEIRSMLCVPVVHSNELLGVLVCVDLEPNHFIEDDLRLLTTIANAAASGVRNAQMFRQMQALKETAEAASRAKSAFLTNMSHELRTPLNAVLGFAQLLVRDAGLGEGQQRAVLSIQRGGEYLLTLISDILDLTRIEAGRFELFPVVWDVAGFIDTLIEMFRIRADQKGLPLHHQPITSLPSRLYCDDKRVRQIAMNLLGNAIKFTEEGRVVLRSGYQEGQLILEVDDTGVGIAQEELARIFEPFQQAGDARYKQQGTGLGLAITQRLTEAMGGRLEVDSVVGRGSRFRVTIPAAPPGQAAPDAADQAACPVRGYRRKTGEGAFRVLIVDDVADNREILAVFLRQQGFECREAADGPACLELAERWRPDLILLDQRLPGMDGQEVTRRLRSRPEDESIVIVAVSSSAFDQDREQAQAAGCAGYLVKPVNFQELTRVIGEHLPLEWDRAAPAPANHVSDEALTPLSAVERLELKGLAGRGDIPSMRETVQRWRDTRPRDPTLLRLEGLIQHYDLKGIRNLLARV